MTDLASQFSATLGSAFTLERELGGGGMSRVFLARDRTLDRAIVIKVLPEDAAASVSVERFKREIALAAKLQHPHIVPLLSSGELNGLPFFTMPFVEGESLRRRLDRDGELPVDEAVQILKEICRALVYAHDQGVIHRDIKPDNILLTGGSTVVTDFGVAKALSAASTKGETTLTQLGVALGTPAYMSPEQASADGAIDQRADLYSLGCTAYELLTGHPPFVGRNAQALLAAHVTEVPEQVSKRRGAIPPALAALVMQCLEKRPADRCKSAADLLRALESVVVTPRGTTAAFPAEAALRQPAPLARPVVLVAAGALVAAALTSAAFLVARAPANTTATSAITVRTTAPIAAGSDQPAIGYNSPNVALSPAGTWLAYIALDAGMRRVYLVHLPTGESRSLAGTDSAKFAFFSPDARQLGFLTDDRVRIIDLQTGTITTLAEAINPTYGWWRPSGEIYFTQHETRTLWKVASAGGRAEAVPRVVGATDIVSEETFLVLRGTGINRTIALHDVRSGITNDLVRGHSGRYSPSGHLLFVRDGSLYAAPLDLIRRAIGQPVMVAAGVLAEMHWGMGHFAVSPTGALVHATGPDLSTGIVAWVDRAGTVTPTGLPPRIYGTVDAAPDANRFAVLTTEVQEYITIWNESRKEAIRLPTSESETHPVWSPDGSFLATYSANAKGEGWSLRIREGTGAYAEVQRLGSYTEVGSPRSWSPDGQVIALNIVGAPYTVTFANRGGGRAEPSFRGSQPSFSPDGKWIAFWDQEEIMVQPYPARGPRRQLTTEGGFEPRWLPSGEIMYRVGNRWYSMRVTTTPELAWTPPEKVFETDFIDTPGISWDVSKDARRLLVVKRPSYPQITELTVIPNWLASLERR